MLADLDLMVAPFEVRAYGFRPGRVTRRRTRVKSPFVDGASTVYEALDEADLGLDISIKEVSGTALWAAQAVLVAAFSQSLFTVTLDVNGDDRGYACEAADYGEVPEAGGGEGTFDDRAVLAFRSTMRFICPRDPVPTAGPI